MLVVRIMPQGTLSMDNLSVHRHSWHMESGEQIQYCPSEEGAAARSDTNATSNAAYRRPSQHTTARTELVR